MVEQIFIIIVLCICRHAVIEVHGYQHARRDSETLIAVHNWRDLQVKGVLIIDINSEE